VTENQYTKLVLEATPYAELRHRRGFLSRLSIAAKIGGCSGLFFLAALLAPIVAALPPAVKAQYVASDPLRVELSVSMLALFGCGCLFLASLGLAWIAIRRSPVEELSTDDAYRLVGLEDICTGLAFVTGTLGIASALTFASMGLFGVETIDNVAAVGIDPYQTTALTPTPIELSAVAACGGAGTAVLSIVVHLRWEIEYPSLVGSAE